MAGNKMTTCLLLFQLVLVAFGRKYDYDDDRFDDVDSTVEMLEHQLKMMTSEYERDIAELTDTYRRLDDANTVLAERFRTLEADYNVLSLEYGDMEDRFRRFEHNCLPTEDEIFEMNYGLEDYASKSGWHLVMRAVAGNGENVFDAWQSGGSYKKFYRDCDKVYCYACHHWRSYKVDDWENLQITEVKIEFYRDDNRVAYMIFNGQDSTMFNWFDEDRITSSSWDVGPGFPGLGLDLDNLVADFSVFVTGTTTCATHEGWFYVQEIESNDCAYYQRAAFPAFMYSSSNSESDFDEFEEAQIMAIYIKYNSPTQLSFIQW